MAHAIPTEYGGIRMRSRLEATWAAFFDLLGWQWEYEPFDLSGYIPDFVVPNPTDNADSVLIDVKPVAVWPEYDARARELMSVGWHGDILVLGTAPRSYKTALALGHWVRHFSHRDDAFRCYDKPWERGLYDAMGPGLRADVDLFGWINPAELVQHRCGFKFPLPGFCPKCREPMLDYELVAGDDPANDGFGLASTGDPVDRGLVLALWAAAKNRAQWRGAFDGV